MPRTRNITRAQWEAAVSTTADPSASAIRSQGPTSIQCRQLTSRSSFGYDNTSVDSSSKENRGCDREYDDSNDENAAAANGNAPPVVESPIKAKGKGKAKEEVSKGRKRKLQPLQDITDLVVSHRNRGSDVEDTPRGGRRVKRRRRESQIPLAQPPSSATRRMPPTWNPLPSPLPPSSPPPPASFELSTSNARFINEVLEGVIPEEQEELPLASDEPEPARNSDPFGFFAVEKELKAKRDPPGAVSEAGGLVLVPASSPISLQLDITAVLDGGQDDEIISPCVTPTTPHKKRKRTFEVPGKGKENEGHLYSPRTESLPSSPSPLKVRTPRVKGKVLQNRSDFVKSTPGPSDWDHKEANSKESEDDGKETVRESPPRRVLRSRVKGKQVEEPAPLPGRRPRMKRQRESKSKTPSDPMELAQKLIDRLPKRRAKKNDNDNDEEPPKCRPRRTKQPPKPQSKKQAKEEKSWRYTVAMDKERDSIREYFKKLETYSLEEEKVYVI